MIKECSRFRFSEKDTLRYENRRRASLFCFSTTFGPYLSQVVTDVDRAKA